MELQMKQEKKEIQPFQLRKVTIEDIKESVLLLDLVTIRSDMNMYET
jgi:hypothetical protein